MTKLVLVSAVAILLHIRICCARNFAAQLADAHFTQFGARLPTASFKKALDAASVDISHLSCRRSLVILAMANDGALNQTVPLFIKSLGSVGMLGGRQAGQTLDRHLVLVTLSQAALDSCRALNADFGHYCVHDTDHREANGFFGFHSPAFNALGFNRIKYILNGLSLGHDIVFLDTDMILTGNPLPYFLAEATDMHGALEKCLVMNASLALTSGDVARVSRSIPAVNIGVLYFKGTAAVTRCVYNWLWDMYGQVPVRSKVWDQDLYGIIMRECASEFSLTWRVLDPRRFQSACFPACGCSYADDLITDSTLLSPVPGTPPVSGHRCAPEAWKKWLLRHFPCSGTTTDKAQYMSAMMEGLQTGQPADITWRW